MESPTKEAKTFRKRKGTTNKGTEYEVLNIADAVMNLVTDEEIKDFHISSNDEEYGAFDDLVIETEREKGTETFALQLKHNDRVNLQLIQLTKAQGDFSIKKYFESSKVVKSTNVKFILYTNLKFNVENDKKFCLDGENFLINLTKVDSSSWAKIFTNTGSCYKCSIAEDDNHAYSSENILQYKPFFENFYLFTNQKNLKQLKRSVGDKFKNLFCGSQIECDQYVKIFTEWGLKEGVKEKLNKKWMKMAIALKIFYSRIKPMSFSHSNENLKTTIKRTYILKRNILREAIEAFDVTIFTEDSYVEVKSLWDDAAIDLKDLKRINTVRKNYQLDSTKISDVAQADPSTLSILLWLIDKRPLILKHEESVNKALELCVGKKAILLKGDGVESLTKNIRAFETLADLKIKTSEFDKVLHNFTCSLQGKTEVPLKNVLKDNDEILTVLKTDDLLEMLKGECRIGEEKEKLPDPYMGRRLLKNAVDIKMLDNITKNTVVLLDCVTQTAKLNHRLQKYQVYNISDDLDPKNQQLSTTIYLSKERCNYSQFDAICSEVQNVQHFHHFRVKDDGDLEWIRSKGHISAVERFKLSKCYTVEESDMSSIDFENNINLLNSDPGMGKSELTKSFKINCFPQCFTVILDPYDIFSFLKTKPEPSNYVEAFQKFLLDEKYKTFSERDRAILSIFLKRNKVVYVWDALDELSIENRKIITNVIVELPKNCVQWVTSRCHLQNILENEFNVFALNLNKIEQNEQKDYIGRRLANLCSSQNVEEIIKKIESNLALVEHKDILGIPLQIFMLTEIFRQNPKKYSDLLNDMFTLTELYLYFIEEKFNIIYKKEFGENVTRKLAAKILKTHTNKLLAEYMNAALRLLFPEEILTKLAVPNRENYEEIYDKDEDIGLVTEIKDQIPRFVHNSFAEYLAARYFADNFQQHKNIMQEFMFDERYNNVRFFFDLILAKGSQPLVAVLHRNVEHLESCDSDILRSTDSGGRTVLHLACSWGQRYPKLAVKYERGNYGVDEGLFKTVQESEKYLAVLNFLLKKCDVSQSDQIYNMTPRQYAQKSTCLLAEMRVFMENPITESIETNCIINMLYYSACCGYNAEFKFYFKLFKKRIMLSRVADKVKNKKGMTLFCVVNLLGHNEIAEFLHEKGADISLAKNYGLNFLTAVENGNYVIVEFFIKTGAKINLPLEDGRMPLHIASLEGHETIVKLLVETGADINPFDIDGYTPLQIASLKGHEGVVKILLRAGANSNLPSKDGLTPLHIALQNRHETIVEMLLAEGADSNLPLEDGRTPLHIASQNGHETIVEMLLKKGADNKLRDKDGHTPLQIASLKGLATIVEMLLKAGADSNLPLEDGRTPLHIASENGQETIVKMLLKAKADSNLPLEDGRTPLRIAFQNGHETIAKMLLKAGADSNLPFEDGRTPLHIASQNGHEKFVQMLLTSGADSKLLDNDSYTPLYIASQNGHETIVEMLLKAGADSNLPLKGGRTPLHIASENGQETIVKMLLKAEADSNHPLEDGRTPLHIASENGQETIVKMLLKAKADSNLPLEDGRTPLRIAFQNGHETIAKMLLKAGADSNLPFEDGRTPLHIASQNGHEKFVQMLLTSGAGSKLLDKDGHTPLYIASQNGHETIVEMLLKAGADSNLPLEDGQTPLHVASQNGHLKIVEILLKAGANINLPGKDGRTPLHIASESDHESIVEMLLKKRADSNLPDIDGFTPLYIASEKGHETIVDMLLKKGADFSLSNKDGFTPLYIASEKGHETIVQRLVKEGANTNFPDEDGYNLLCIASLKGNEAIVKILLKAGADSNLPSKDGFTPLHLASQNGHEAIVQVLLTWGADTNLPDKDGHTALCMASLKGHETIVKILLKAGANINLPLENGSMPLFLASQNGHETIVEILLKVGADVNLTKKDGSTPLHIASQNGHETIVEILLKAGANINLRDEDGHTPLCLASQNGHETIIKILLKDGAVIAHPDKCGQKAYEIGSVNAFVAIAVMAFNASADINLPDN